MVEPNNRSLRLMKEENVIAEYPKYNLTITSHRVIHNTSNEDSYSHQIIPLDNLELNEIEPFEKPTIIGKFSYLHHAYLIFLPFLVTIAIFFGLYQGTIPERIIAYTLLLSVVSAVVYFYYRAYWIRTLQILREDTVVLEMDISRRDMSTIKSSILSAMHSSELLQEVNQSYTKDQAQLIRVAAENEGKLSKSRITDALSWDSKHISRVIAELEDAGMVIEETTMQDGTVYWFPELVDSSQ